MLRCDFVTGLPNHSTSGFFLMLRTDKIIAFDISVNEDLKYIVR